MTGHQTNSQDKLFYSLTDDSHVDYAVTALAYARNGGYVKKFIST